eukprot:10776693-Alexandrium_andersonii.AAC.1
MSTPFGPHASAKSRLRPFRRPARLNGDAWDGGFFGNESVCPTAPSLGCSLTSQWYEGSEGRPGRWPPEAID